MNLKLTSIVDRLSYIRSCYCVDECLVFEMVNLTPNVTNSLFDGEKKHCLSLLFDVICSMAEYPFQGSLEDQLDFLIQLLHEYDFYSSPSSYQILRESEFVEWSRLAQIRNSKMDIQKPKLYKSYGKIKFLRLKPASAKFDLSPKIIANTACFTMERVLTCLITTKATSNSGTVTKHLDLTIQSLMNVMVKPLVDAIYSECQYQLSNEINAILALYCCLFQ